MRNRNNKVDKSLYRVSRVDNSISKTVRSQLKKEMMTIWKEITDNFSNRDMVKFINQRHVTKMKTMRKARR